MADVNVIKRGNYWQYRFEGAKVEGKRKQISKSGFKTKKECLEAGIQALAEYNRSGSHFEPSEMSVSDYLDYWLDNYCKMNLKASTQLGYLTIIENHLKPTFGKYKLCSLTTASIQEYTNALKIKGFSKSSVMGIISTFSGALNYAIEPLHYLQTNPCNNIRYPKFNEKKGETRYIISDEDFSRIIDRFPQDNNFYLPLMIGYHTGLRISECFGLTWDDIDFQNHTLTVNKQIVKRNYGVDVRQVLMQKGKKEEKSAWYFGEPKTLTSNRTIEIGETLMKALTHAKTMKKKNEWMYGDYYTKVYKKPETDEKGNTIFRLVEIEKGIPCSLDVADMICVRENGQMITSDSFKYCARVIHNELKIAFNFHSLRHTHATTLIGLGISEKIVQERLGHTNITTTLQTYTHTTKSMEHESIEKFEKHLNAI